MSSRDEDLALNVLINVLIEAEHDSFNENLRARLREAQKIARTLEVPDYRIAAAPGPCLKSELREIIEDAVEHLDPEMPVVDVLRGLLDGSIFSMPTVEKAPCLTGEVLEALEFAADELQSRAIEKHGSHLTDQNSKAIRNEDEWKAGIALRSLLSRAGRCECGARVREVLEQFVIVDEPLPEGELHEQVKAIIEKVIRDMDEGFDAARRAEERVERAKEYCLKYVGGVNVRDSTAEAVLAILEGRDDRSESAVEYNDRLHRRASALGVEWVGNDIAGGPGWHSPRTGHRYNSIEEAIRATEGREGGGV